MTDLQVVLGFDMETDIGSWTPYYEGLQHGAPVDVADAVSAGLGLWVGCEALAGHESIPSPSLVNERRVASELIM